MFLCFFVALVHLYVEAMPCLPGIPSAQGIHFQLLGALELLALS